MVRTNAHFLVTALIRTYAIWLGGQILIALPTTLIQVESLGRGGLDFFLGIDVATLLIAAGVWLFADVIAGIGVARRQPAFESDMSFQDWQSIFFSAIGLWLLVQGILHLVAEAGQWMILYRTFTQRNIALPSDDGRSFARSLSALLETAIGVGLLLGGRGLAGLLHRIRSIGAVPREEGPVDE
jgi:hypothetical protein